MPIVRTADVQAVGLSEALWVAVCCTHHGDHGLALADQLASEFHIGRGQPGRVLAGALITEQLLYRGWDQGGDPIAAGQVGRGDGAKSVRRFQ